MAGMVMTKLSPSRPVSALVARGETPSFLYASSWASQKEQQEMLFQRDVQRAAGATENGFTEKDPQCTRTVERRVKKLIAAELPLSNWNCQQVLDWLEYRGLQQHRELFKRAEVDGKVVQRLSSESIRTAIGIQGLGHRRAIVEELRQLKSYLAEHSSTSIRPGTSHNNSSPTRPQSARNPNAEELSQLRLQRAQWQRDRLHLMSMLGRKPTFLTVPAEEWSPHEVCDWIDYIGLNWYRKSLAHGAIDGALLTSMTDKLLEAELGIKSLEHRRFLLEKIKELQANGAVTENTEEEKESAQLNRTQLGQVQGQLRECDFNIMRLDQRIARAKKIVGIHEPKTNEYRSAMERARDERANMAETRINKPGEQWWERQFKAFETKVKHHHELRQKFAKEERKGNRMD